MGRVGDFNVARPSLNMSKIGKILTVLAFVAGLIKKIKKPSKYEQFLKRAREIDNDYNEHYEALLAEQEKKANRMDSDSFDYYELRLQQNRDERRSRFADLVQEILDKEGHGD